MVGHVLLGALTQESQESELDWVRVVHKLVKRNKQTNKQTKNKNKGQCTLPCWATLWVSQGRLTLDLASHYLTSVCMRVSYKSDFT